MDKDLDGQGASDPLPPTWPSRAIRTGVSTARCHFPVSLLIEMRTLYFSDILQKNAFLILTTTSFFRKQRQFPG